MRAILDTHVFLWWNMNDSRLSEVARQFIADGQNELYLSAASAWEIAIKCARNRLVLPEAPGVYVASRIAAQGFQPLPVQISHALHVYDLPDIHQDPFDRLIIAQSRLEDFPVLTADDRFPLYPINVIW